MALAVLLACCGAAFTARVHHAAASGRAVDSAASALLAGEIVRYERATWHWERVMGAPLTETAGRVLAQMSSGEARQTLRLWRRRAEAALRRAERPPHLKAWLCIHRYEAAWTDADAPYYGGLQMNLSFQERYGRRLLQQKGTADHWTPLEQMWTAEKALRSRGFRPWPNTARYCGLL